MSDFNFYYPVIVVGAGHAGCEAALATARLSIKTMLVTMNLSNIALMPCNPSIGGPGKGHLVREIGALGGEMANCVDQTFIQLKWLNISKGPAVRSRRAQIDKVLYRHTMTQTLFNTKNLFIKEGHATEIIVENGTIKGIKLETGMTYYCDKLILTSGTYLKSKVIIGRNITNSGPHNQRSAQFLSDSLQKNGIMLRRLQTATPMRILKSSIDYSKLKELPGDENSGGFLWENRLKKSNNMISCFLTLTNENTIKAVKANLSESPLILENITNEGPGHCPSIDRKIMRFPEQFQHQIFIEPEGRYSNELYLQGLTTGMSPNSQRQVLASVPGLESAIITRYGYAIEYDALAPAQIKKTMETRHLAGLYTAGQINGTSGYEEAAAQGLIAGINAALSLKNMPPYSPSRTLSYIGVLVDDLSTWDKPQPYRITPGHAEFRLTLRDESAEKRLIKDAYDIGLVTQKRYDKISAWIKKINDELQVLSDIKIYPTKETKKILQKFNSGDLKKMATAYDMLQRSEINYNNVFELLPKDILPALNSLDEIYCLETEIKYSGYFQREEKKIQETKLFEQQKLPFNSAVKELAALSDKAINCLTSDKYEDLNQLVRKNCLSRAEIGILLLHLNNAGSE